MADQSIKNLEDQQDEYDFKVNTLKNRGEGEEKCIRWKNTANIILAMRTKIGSKSVHIFVENEINGMTAKELEQEKLTMNRMCLELKAKRQVSRNR